MNRRNFIQRGVALGAASAVTAATPLKALAGDPVVSGSYRTGQRYRSACGQELVLEAVDQQRLTPRSRSYRLCFRGEACTVLGEGTHTLSGPNGDIALFLQPSADGGLVAWFNHLG
ncbi:MAG: twin-arginine translocation signal domain-containing protein [Lysobacteraceae bacterium]